MELRRSLLMQKKTADIDYFADASWVAGKYINANGGIGNNGLMKYSDPAIVIPTPGEYKITGKSITQSTTSINSRLHGYDNNDDWLGQITYWSSQLNEDYEVIVNIPSNVYSIRLGTGNTYALSMVKTN